MQSLRRLLALLFVIVGWKSSQAQPAPKVEEGSNPPAQSGQSPSVPAGLTPLPSTSIVQPSLAGAMKDQAMSVEQEQKAREVLRKTIDQDLARAAAAAPARTGVPPGTAGDAQNQPGSKAEVEAAREREIARIEAEVLKAQQAR